MSFDEIEEEDMVVIKILEGSGMSFVKIENDNFKPHLFVSLTEDEAEDEDRCAMDGCRLQRSEHTSERIIFLKLDGEHKDGDKVELTDAQKEILKKLMIWMMVKKIDGFSFVK